MYDIAIIGAGPAGLSGALMADSVGMATCLIESGPLGGTVAKIGHVTNFLSDASTGPELVERWQRALEATACTLVRDHAEELIPIDGEWRVRLASGADIVAGYVVVAAGNRWVRLDEHPLIDGVAGNIEVIDFWPTEYRRILDADRPLIVGSDRPLGTFVLTVADEWGIEATAWPQVLVLPDKAYALSDVPTGVELDLLWADSVDSIRCDGAGYVVEYRRGGVTTQVYASDLVPNLGTRPNNEMLAGHVAIDEAGYVSGDLPPRLFLAGDLVQPSHRRIATAVGEGAYAVLSAYYEAEGLL
jgi:thioredoxin reductase (NADPH)